MELRDIVRAVRRRRVVVLITVTLVVGVTLGALWTTKVRYRSTVVVSVSPSAASGVSVYEIEYLLPSLAAEASTSTTVEAAVGSLPVSLATRARNSDLMASAEPVTGTSLVRLVVEAGDPGVTAPVANALAEQLVTTETTRRQLEVRAIDTATGLGQSSSRLPLLGAGVVLSLIAGVFAALLAQAYAPLFSDGDDLRRRLGVRVLGNLPATRWLARESDCLLDTTSRLATVPMPARMAAALERASAELDILTRSHDVRTVVVTSLLPREGTTTVAAALATGLAKAGVPTVAVDADLRHAACLQARSGEALGWTVETGIDDMAVRPTSNLRLTVVPRGESRDHPAGLTGRRLPDLLTQLPGQVVLLDTASLATAAETRLAASVADAAVLVVDARKRTVAEVDEALAQLADAGVPIVTVVVNRQRSRRALRPLPARAHAASAVPGRLPHL